MKSKKPLLLALDIEHSSVETLTRLLQDPGTGGPLLDRIARRHHRDQTLMELLVNHSSVTPQTLLFLYGAATEEFKKRIQRLKRDGGSGPAEKGSQSVRGSKDETALIPGGTKVVHPTAAEPTLYQRIQTMTVAEKVQFALRAGKDARSLLLKDPNRQVAQAVLSSPKLTEDEVLLIAQSRNVSDDILRTVSKNKDWIKNYSVLFALVSNPKTPLGTSMPLLPSVRTKDLSLLAKNRNIPEAIRTGANRLLLAKQKQS